MLKKFFLLFFLVCHACQAFYEEIINEILPEAVDKNLSTVPRSVADPDPVIKSQSRDYVFYKYILCRCLYICLVINKILTIYLLHVS
jgi:hypothetical protein